MATTTTTLALRKPATTDTVDVSTDLNTPYDTIDDQFEKGSDVASATSITVPNEGYFDITGTTTTAGFSTVNAGIMKMVQFDGVLQLTHNSSSFNLPTGANITTAAGDRALFRSEGSGNWRCMWYQRASGGALAIADNSVDSDAYVDGSIDTAHLAADAVTGAKIADDALDSEHYTDGSIDAAHLASSAVTTAKINADAVTGAKIADDAIDSEHYTDGSIDTAHIADNQVTLAKLSDGTQGGVLYYGASGAPTELAAGTSGYFLKTQGGSANPVWASAGGGMVQQTVINAPLTSGTTTSTSYVDIPSSDGQVTLTTTGGDLLVWYSAVVRSDTDNQYSYVAIEIDGGSEVAESRLRTADANVSGTYVGFHRFTSVSSGSHTVSMRWRVAGNTSTMEAYGGIIMQEIS
jgi:hypothetical protein